MEVSRCQHKAIDNGRVVINYSPDCVDDDLWAATVGFVSTYIKPIAFKLQPKCLSHKSFKKESIILFN